MSKNPENIKNEYLVLVNIIKKRFEKHNQIFTINKEIIFKILFESCEHLCVDEIVQIAQDKFKSELKESTVYRILSSFETLGIVDNIIIDDKKRFELVYFKKPHYHIYCQECNKVEEFESAEIHQAFLNHLMEIEFKPTNFNVIINGVCKKCQN